MVARVLILIVAVAGCEKQSELYCGKHPDDIANCGYSDAGIDARPTCKMAEDCTGAAAPHCELASGSCVACLDDTHCTAPSAPYCDTSTYSCKGCVSHTECPSQACLPSGECGGDDVVAYVDPQATAITGCTVDDPCQLIEHALATDRPYIKLTGQIVEPVTISANNVTFLADPDTTLSRVSGIVVTVSNGSTVAVYDLTIVGTNESGIVATESTVRLFRTTLTGSSTKDKPAVEAKTSSTLTMSRCLVHSNPGGGIYADSTTTYNITNTFIYRNGADDGAYGGATLQATNPGERTFEMNTVVDNRAKVAASAAGGVACSAGGLAIPNNLIVRNYAGGSATALSANELLTGGCNTSGSMTGSDVMPYAFVMPDGPGPWDYHVGAGSMAIDRGSTSDIGFDYDGQIRPQGAAVDVGADEYKQP